MVAVAPGAAASSDSPSGDGSLESLLEGSGKAGERAGSAGRARPGPSEARSTTIDLSAAADPAPRRRGVVPLRRIVGARPPSGLWQARARRSARIGGWMVGAITVSAGLVALWVLLFTTVSGGDVWLGRPLAPTKHDQNATQRSGVPGSPGAGSLAPSSVPPKPATKAAVPSPTSGKGHGGSASATSGSGSGTSGSGTSGSGTSGSGTSGRNGADDPPGDDSGGTRTTSSTSGTSSGSGSSGSGSTSGGSGSTSGGSGSGSGSGSGGHG